MKNLQGGEQNMEEVRRVTCCGGGGVGKLQIADFL